MNRPSFFLWLVAATMIGAAGAREIPFGATYAIHNNLDGAAAVAVADLDRDGLDDIVLAAIDADTLAIRFNGTPGSWITLSSSFDQAITVSTADMDGDGWIDVVGGKRGTGANAVRWWRNPGAAGGAWPENPIVGTTVSGVRSIVAGDMDNDGDQDLVSASFQNSSEGFVTVFENVDGAGTAWTLHEIDADAFGAHTIRLGDINGDGRLDVVMAAYHLNVVGWYLNAGLGTPWALRLVFGPVNEAIGLDLSDMDADGDLDIVAGSFGDGEVAWYQNWVSYGFDWVEQPVVSGIGGVYDIEIVDLDVDGDLDIVTAGRSDGEVVWIEQLASSWIKRVVATDFDGARSARSTDLDGDGDLDIVAVAEFADDVAWRENAAMHWSALFPHEEGPSSAPGVVTSLATGDLDADGDLDLAATVFNQTDAADLLVWLRHAGSWMPPTAVDTELNGAERVRLADIDRDGHLDLFAVGSRTLSTLAWYEFEMVNSYTKHVITSTVEALIDFDLGDLDCDGDLDIATAVYLGNSFVLYVNSNGDGSVWNSQIGVGAPSPSAIRLTDSDHEGGADIIVTNYAGNEVTRFRNQDCDFSLAHNVMATNIDGPVDVAIADFNRDGWNDVAVASAAGDTLDVLLNQNGTTWSKHAVATDIGGISSVYAADLENDGNQDLVVTTATTGTVTWWSNFHGNGTTWLPMPAISNALSGAETVTVSDLDPDGLLDILAAGTESESITVFSNAGGQINLDTWDRAPATVEDSGSAVIFKVALMSAAQQGDPEIELEQLSLLFLDESGGSISDSEIQALLDSIQVWHDSDMDGTMDAGLDTLLVSDSGIAAAMAVSVPPGNPNPAIAMGELEAYFVVAVLAPDASTHNPTAFKIRHRPLGDTLAHYRLAPWINLVSPYWESVESGVVTVLGIDPDLVFSDSFESTVRTHLDD